MSTICQKHVYRCVESFSPISLFFFLLAQDYSPFFRQNSFVSIAPAASWFFFQIQFSTWAIENDPIKKMVDFSILF